MMENEIKKLSLKKRNKKAHIYENNLVIKVVSCNFKYYKIISILQKYPSLMEWKTHIKRTRER